MKVRRIIWALPFIMVSCSNYELDDIDYMSVFKEDAMAKEALLSSKLHLTSETVQLMGCKTIPIPADERREFNSWFGKMDEFINNERIYYAEDGSYFLMYSNLADAVVLIDGCDTLYADDNGKISISKDYKTAVVLGRKKSEHVLGTGHSKVVGDLILFDKPLVMERNSGNVLFYDLGVRNCSAQCSENKKSFLKRLFSKSDPEPNHGCEDKKVSCLENHGGVNCSNAFGINNGRCEFNPNVCMDYNGWGTDCIDGKTINFPGSDCYTAILHFHCWNEI